MVLLHFTAPSTGTAEDEKRWAERGSGLPDTRIPNPYAGREVWPTDPFKPLMLDLDKIAANTGATAPLPYITGGFGGEGSQIERNIGRIAQNTGIGGALFRPISDSYFTQREAADALTGEVTPRLDNISASTSGALTSLTGQIKVVAPVGVGVNNANWSSYLSHIQAQTDPIYGIYVRLEKANSYLAALPATQSLTTAIRDNIGFQGTYGSVNAQLRKLWLCFSRLYPTKFYGQGGVGMTPAGGMTATLGEAAGEAYAILKAPRTVPVSQLGLSGGVQTTPSGSVVIPIYLEGREIARYVTNWQDLNARRSTTLRAAPGGSY